MFTAYKPLAEKYKDIKMKMTIPCFQHRRKLTSGPGSRSATSTAKIKTTIPCFFSCFTPFRRRNSTIFHYASAQTESMIEENERLQLESEVDESLSLTESTIDDLPDTLLVDIFQRLPVNIIFRSKCVSKRWLALISDPFFALSYNSRRHSFTRPFALFYVGFVPESDHPSDIIPYCPPVRPESMIFPLYSFKAQLQKKQNETYPLELIGIHNDLLLFTGVEEPFRDSYCVCNPLTFEWISLPCSPRYGPRYSAVGFMVENDGTFWVVQILSPESELSRALIFQVFCSGTGKWCSKKVFFSCQTGSFWAKTTVVYQGFIIWMLKNRLLAFDPKNDCSWNRVIDLPNDEKGRFGVSSGRLHYYEVSCYIPWNPVENPILRVWEMINFEDGEWVLQKSIRYGHLWSSDEFLKKCLLVPKKNKKYFEWVSFHPIDSDVVFLKCDGQLVICNISSACLEVVPSRGKCLQRSFYRVERDALPLVFQTWPRPIAENNNMINEASTS